MATNYSSALANYLRSSGTRVGSNTNTGSRTYDAGGVSNYSVGEGYTGAGYSGGAVTTHEYNPYQSQWRSGGPQARDYQVGANYQARTGADAYTPYASQYRAFGPGVSEYDVGEGYAGAPLGAEYTPYESQYRRAYSRGMEAPDYTRTAGATPERYQAFLEREYAGLAPITDEQGRTQYDIARERIRGDYSDVLEEQTQELRERLSRAGMADSGMAFKQERQLVQDIERERARAEADVTLAELAAAEARAERLGQQAFESSERGRELINNAWQFMSQQDFDAWAKEQDIASEDIDRAWRSAEEEKSRLFQSTERGRELTQDAWRFTNEQEFKQWAREQDIADFESELAWQAAEAERMREFKSTERGRELTQDAWQFRSEQDFKTWAREQDIADAEAEMAWKSMEQDRQRVFESTERGRQLVQDAWKFENEQEFQQWAKEQELSQADIDRAWKARENQLERENRLDQIIQNTIGKITEMDYQDALAARAQERETRSQYYHLLGASGEQLGATELLNLQRNDPLAYYAYQGGQAGKTYQAVQAEEALRINYLDTLLAAAFDDPETTLALEDLAYRYGIDLPEFSGGTGTVGGAGTGTGDTGGTGTTYGEPAPAGQEGYEEPAEISDSSRMSWGSTEVSKSSEDGLEGWKARATEVQGFGDVSNFEKVTEVLRVLPDGSVQWKYRSEDPGVYHTAYNPQGEYYQNMMETAPEWKRSYNYNKKFWKKEKGWYFDSSFPGKDTYFTYAGKLWYRPEDSNMYFLDYPDTQAVTIVDVATGVAGSWKAKEVGRGKNVPGWVTGEI